MGVKEFLFGFMFLAIFVIAIISFGYSFASEHNTTVGILNDSNARLLYSGVNSTIYSFDSGGSIQLEANDSLTAFNQEDPTESTGSDGVLFRTITAVGKSIMSIGNSIFTVVWNPLLKMVLPNSREVRQVISVILTTMMLFLITLLAWRLYRTGS